MHQRIEWKQWRIHAFDMSHTGELKKGSESIILILHNTLLLEKRWCEQCETSKSEPALIDVKKYSSRSVHMRAQLC